MRAERARELAELSTQKESAYELIGLLKDDPDAVKVIRQSTLGRSHVVHSRQMSPVIVDSDIFSELLAQKNRLSAQTPTHI